MPIISSIFQKAEEKETLSSSFYEARIILVPKPEHSYYRKKKKYRRATTHLIKSHAKLLTKIECVCVCVCINHHDLLSLSQECKSGLTFKIISMQFTILKFYTKTIHLNRCSESI